MAWEREDAWVARVTGLDAGRLVCDARNCAHEYVADCVDALERVVRHELGGASWRVEAKARCVEGLDRLHEALHEAVEPRLQAWEEEARATGGALEVPPGALGEPGGPAAGEAQSAEAAAQEEALDAELSELRARVAASRGACRAMREELRDLEAELAECGDVAALESAVTQNREGLAQDTERLASAAMHLRGLLPRVRAAGKPSASPLASRPVNVHRAPKSVQKAVVRQRSEGGLEGVTLKDMEALRERLNALR